MGGDVFCVALPKVGGNEWTKCGWVSLWDGDLGGLFYLFGAGFLDKMVGADIWMRIV